MESADSTAEPTTRLGEVGGEAPKAPGDTGEVSPARQPDDSPEKTEPPKREDGPKREDAPDKEDRKLSFDSPVQREDSPRKGQGGTGGKRRGQADESTTGSDESDGAVEEPKGRQHSAQLQLSQPPTSKSSRRRRAPHKWVTVAKVDEELRKDMQFVADDAEIDYEPGFEPIGPRPQPQTIDFQRLWGDPVDEDAAIVLEVRDRVRVDGIEEREEEADKAEVIESDLVTEMARRPTKESAVLAAAVKVHNRTHPAAPFDPAGFYEVPGPPVARWAYKIVELPSNWVEPVKKRVTPKLVKAEASVFLCLPRFCAEIH